eukprot:UN28231
MSQDAFAQKHCQFLWHGRTLHFEYACSVRISDDSIIIGWKFKSHCACLHLGEPDLNSDCLVFVRLHEVTT